MPPTEPGSEQRLVRAIGVRGLTANIVNTTVGAGIFVARDGLLPAPLARVHPRFHTPWLAILTHAVLVWGLASLGSFGVLALLSNVALLCSYLLCCLAAIELRRRDVRTDRPPFVLPGGPLVPVLACVVLLWLLSHATTQEFLVTGGAVAVAALLFAWRGMRTRAPLVDPV